MDEHRGCGFLSPASLDSPSACGWRVRAARGLSGWRRQVSELLVPRLDRVTYDEARDDLRRFYETYKTRSLDEANARLKHLDAFFGGRRLVTIGQDTVTAYAAARQAPNIIDEETLPGAANGTINRELSTLSKMLRLAYEHGKLQRPPIVKKLREADARAGFVPHEQFNMIRRHLPDELKVAMTVAYTFGWRSGRC